MRFLNWIKQNPIKLAFGLAILIFVGSFLFHLNGQIPEDGKYPGDEHYSSYKSVGGYVTILLVDFLDNHGTAIAALAGIAVAAFTGVLWWSTDKLWKEAERQREQARKGGLANVIAARAALRSSRAAEKSANTAERALSALEGPIIRPYGMMFSHNDQAGEISFCFRNFGRSPSVVQGVSGTIIITPANNPGQIQHHITHSFMFEEMIAEKESSEVLIVKEDVIRQHGWNIQRAITDLHFLVNYTWDSLLGPQYGGGTRFIWSPKRQRFLSGIQLWDDPARFPPTKQETP